MSTAALTLGVVGVVLATLSLGWQSASYFLTGPRLKVTLAEGLRAHHGGVLVGPPSIYTEAGRQTLNADGYTERVLALTARNVGRMPTTISAWSIRFANGALYTLPQHPQNRPVPYRLDVHDEVSWYAPLGQLRSYQAVFTDQSDEAAAAVAVIDLATGVKVEGRPRLRIRADAGDADCVVITGLLAHTLARVGRGRRG